MNCEDQGKTTQPPWQVTTVYGEPYQVGGFKLTPVARVLTYAVGQGTLRLRSVSGWAAGLVSVRPVAVVTEQDGREQRIALAGTTAGALAAMVTVGAAITLLLWASRLLARGARRRQQTE